MFTFTSNTLSKKSHLIHSVGIYTLHVQVYLGLDLSSTISSL